MLRIIVHIASEALLPFLSVGDLCSVRSLGKFEALITKGYMDNNDKKMEDEFETVLEERDEVAAEFFSIRTADDFRRFEDRHPNGPQCLDPRAAHLAHMERFYRRQFPKRSSDEALRLELRGLHLNMWRGEDLYADWLATFREANPAFGVFIDSDQEWRMRCRVPLHNASVRCLLGTPVPFYRFHVLKGFFEKQTQTRNTKRNREPTGEEKENHVGN